MFEASWDAPGARCHWTGQEVGASTWFFLSFGLSDGWCARAGDREVRNAASPRRDCVQTPHDPRNFASCLDNVVSIVFLRLSNLRTRSEKHGC